MHKKIAIQLYGHLRSFEQTCSALFENLISPNEDYGISFDIFIHTWDEIDAKQKVPHYEKNTDFAGLKLTEKQIDSVKEKYKPKKLLIESQIGLTKEQEQIIAEKKYDKNMAEVFNNISHTFYSVNKLRVEYEQETGTEYDLVIILRPDILLYETLDLAPFYNKQGGWQFFDEKTIEDYVFSPYINGFNSQKVICPNGYIAGLDLLSILTPYAANKLMNWKNDINECLNLWAEQALIKIMNKYGLKHSFIVYEKDKFWTILRVGTQKKMCLENGWRGVVNMFYKTIIPLLLKSNLYCRHSYLNVTTYKNKEGLSASLTKILGRKIRIK